MTNSADTQTIVDDPAAMNDRELEIASLRAELQDARQIEDADVRDEQLGIIGAKLEDVIAQEAADQQTFADSVRALDASLEKLEFEVEGYEKFDADEEGVITAAQAEVDDAQAKIDDLDDAVFFKGTRKNAAQIELQDAEGALNRATAEAERMRSIRRANADIEQSTTRYITSGGVVSSQAEVRLTHVETQITSLDGLMETTEGELTEETANVEAQRAVVETFVAELTSAEEALDEETAGTESYQAAENAVREAKIALEEATNLRDKMLARTNGLKSFLQQTETSLDTQRKLKRNLEIIIEVIETGLEKRVPLIESRLDQMKSLETLQAGRQVASVGDSIDESNAAYSAKAANAADELVTSYLEEAPRTIQTQRQIAEEQAANAAAHKARVQKLWDAYDTDYDTASAA